MDGKLNKAEADKILAEARERLALCIEAEADNRAEALDDLRFLAGEQWDDDAKRVRKNRPCLTINRLPQFVRQVVNEQRKARPAVDVIPADGKAAKQTAEVIQGLIRHIERTSKAQAAYDTAFEYAVSCGVGHWRISTDYIDDAGFDQEICIHRIDNPFTVYRDPASREADHADDRFTFVTEFVDPDAFEAKYGFVPEKLEEVGSGDDMAHWFEGKMVRVAEYWRRVDESVTINALSDGSVVEGKIDAERKAQMAALGVTVLQSRKVERKRVEQYILTAARVIKKAEWLGKYIPVVTVLGGELNVDGKRVITSLIRYAKDPARMYNYWASAETEVVALQPKAPWVAPEGTFDDHESEWTRANTENVAYLEYKPVPGQPGPQRQFFPGVPQGIREGRMAAAEDIKAVVGMYDASLGARSNETSGIAIKARQQEGDTATYHFIDNHARAIEHCGRIIIDLIPKVYDTPRTVRILGAQDEAQVVAINQLFIDPTTGQEHIHDLQLGKYEVAVRVGPSFESRRQEMVQAMIELSQVNPQIMQVAGDLVLKNMDWPDSEKIAERLEMLLPPQVKGEQPPPSPEQQLAQAQVEVEQIKAQAAQAKAQADGMAKQADLQVKAAELAVAQKELQIKEYELQLQQAGAVGDAAIKGDEMQLEREKIALEREKVAVELLRTGGLMTPDQTAQKDQMQAAVIAGMQALTQQFGQVAKALMTPKETELISGPDGRPSRSITRPATVN